MACCARFIVFGLLFLCDYLSSYAQFTCRYEKFNTESGLSHNRLTHIIRDKEGFMWMSSWDGLNRYDGQSFKTYKAKPGDLSLVIDDRVDYIVDDEAGNIWVKCSDKHIYRFDKASGEFDPAINRILQKSGCIARTLFYLDKGLIGITTENNAAYLAAVSSNKKVSLSRVILKNTVVQTDSAQFMCSDLQKRIWIGGKHGLIGLSRSGKSSYKIIYQYQDHNGVGITSHAEDTGNMYFGTADGTLLCINKLSLKRKIIAVSHNRITAIKSSRLKPVVYCATETGEIIQISLISAGQLTHQAGGGTKISSIYEDRSGALWLEPGKSGVIRFDPFTHKSQWFAHRLDGNENGTRNYQVFEDQTGRVWINLRGGGLGYYNAEKNAIECEFTDTQGLTGRFPGLVYSIYFDPAGIIWSCTKSGLIKINVPNGEFEQQLIKPSKMLDLQANEVRGLLTDQMNRLWIGTRDGNIKVFQGATQVKVVFDHLSDANFGTVYHIYEDSRGNVWIGTKRNGLFKAVPINAARKTYVVSHYFPDGYRENSPSSNNNVLSVIEDKKGKIWVGTFGTGLYQLVEEDGESRFNHVIFNQQVPGIKNLKIRHMQLDKLGNLWLATTTGLYVVDAAGPGNVKANVAHYSKLAGRAESLGENDIQYILRSRNGSMWLATSGGGLELPKFHNPLKTITFGHYLKNDGLLSDYILSAQEDLAGEIWLGTERGLTRFNPFNGSTRAYGSPEGLFDPAFSEGAVTRQRNGEIVFGTFKGILKFHPAKLSEDRTIAQLAFTNLQINNQDVIVRPEGSVLRKNINSSPNIDLSYHQNTISVDFTILDFEHGADQNIMYRLKGYNDRWQNNLRQRRVTYTNLPAGKYLFEIKCANPKIYTNIPVKTLRIDVAPPAWKTWWAYLIYTFIAAGIITLIWRTVKTILALRESVRVEKKVAELKQDFFTNISHELRTTLTLITNPLSEINEKEKLSVKGRKYMQIIARNTDRLAMFMNQWLDLRRIQAKQFKLQCKQTDLVSFMMQIGQNFAGYGSDVALQIASDQPSVNASIDQEKFDIVIYNILSNAFKYTKHGGSVQVHIATSGKESVTISIADDGVGVPHQKLEDIFKLYYIVNNEDLSGSKGTGIGLAVAREIVNLHGGNIWAENNANGGLTLFITIPANLPQVVDSSEVDEQFQTANVHPHQPPIEEGLLPLITENLGMDQPTVLLVEDNNDLRDLLVSQLSEYYHVKWASDGEAGLKLAVDCNPDLIVSDIMMPKMNGVTMLDRLKSKDSTSHIPVVLLTAKSSIESQIEGIKYGADYYVTKPFSMQLLLTAINNIIKQRQLLFNKLTDHRIIQLNPGDVVITSKDEEFLKKVVKTVEEGMQDPTFSIEKVADAMAMGRTSFYKKFKSLTGITTVDFIRDMRLKRSKQLMDAGEDRVSMVALEVGFNNAKYFSTCFKEKFGVSPSDYLKSVPQTQKGSI